MTMGSMDTTTRFALVPHPAPAGAGHPSPGGRGAGVRERSYSLPEQVLLRIAEQRLRGTAAGRVGVAAHDGDGHAVELAVRELGGGGELVADGHARDLQPVARRVGL